MEEEKTPELTSATTSWTHMRTALHHGYTCAPTDTQRKDYSKAQLHTGNETFKGPEGFLTTEKRNQRWKKRWCTQEAVPKCTEKWGNVLLLREKELLQPEKAQELTSEKHWVSGWEAHTTRDSLELSTTAQHPVWAPAPENIL